LECFFLFFEFGDDDVLPPEWVTMPPWTGKRQNSGDFSSQRTKAGFSTK
jgi:hypothetical protein